MKKLMIIAVLAWVFTTRPVLAACNTAEVKVNGMVCDFCARSLEKLFGQQEAVEGIKVDLDNSRVLVHFKDGKSLTDDAITKLILDSGFNVTAISHEC